MARHQRQVFSLAATHCNLATGPAYFPAHSLCFQCLASLSAVCKILDLPENQEVAVVGTIYKEMKLKPSILQEYNKVTPEA